MPNSTYQNMDVTTQTDFNFMFILFAQISFRHTQKNTFKKTVNEIDRAFNKQGEIIWVQKNSNEF